MREVKYRVWDKENKEMIPWERLHIEFEDGFTTIWIPENKAVKKALLDFELMQYTGLKDKNGIEIYEGDVVRVMDSTLATVKYSDDRGAYYLDCEKKIGDVGLICQYDTIKRVGNVYETPELLEVEE